SIRLLVGALARTPPAATPVAPSAGPNGRAGGPAGEQTCLVEIRRGRGLKPEELFFLPDFTGDLSGLYQLVAAVGPDYSCFGLQPCLGAEDDPALWPEAWAYRYLAAVREQRPNGPYLFVGHSVGGTLGLELARLLLETGYGPVAVALLDSRPKGS